MRLSATHERKGNRSLKEHDAAMTTTHRCNFQCFIRFRSWDSRREPQGQHEGSPSGIRLLFGFLGLNAPPQRTCKTTPNTHTDRQTDRQSAVQHEYLHNQQNLYRTGPFIGVHLRCHGAGIRLAYASLRFDCLNGTCSTHAARLRPRDD